MLTTLVFGVSAATCVGGVAVLLTTDYDRPAFWDLRSCLAHSQLLISNVCSRLRGRPGRLPRL